MTLKGSIADVLGPTRTPVQPRRGEEMSEAGPRALDLMIGRRGEGMLVGDYRSPFPGDGAKLHQVRAYSPGDDVRRIDPNITARAGESDAQIELAERVLTTDRSASTGFGTADTRKADIAEGVMLTTGCLATPLGNRLEVVVLADEIPVRPPRQGRRGMLVAIETTTIEPAGRGSFGEALELLDAYSACG